MSESRASYDAGTLEDAVRETIAKGGEGARAYLREAWLAAAIDALIDCRRGARLTQAEVAHRMGTTQSAIARLENDFRGGISLRRYVDYALACDAVPLHVELKPLQQVFAYCLAEPAGSRTGCDFERWQREGTVVNDATGFDVLMTQGTFDCRHLVPIGSNWLSWSSLPSGNVAWASEAVDPFTAACTGSPVASTSPVVRPRRQDMVAA
jgi:transcriptional regulator with XRE-family HTH domain